MSERMNGMKNTNGASNMHCGIQARAILPGREKGWKGRGKHLQLHIFIKWHAFKNGGLGPPPPPPARARARAPKNDTYGFFA
jgi:hypothetical protein